jgi:hypothetical protein
MSPSFKNPTSQAEFDEREKNLDTKAVLTILYSLRGKKAQATRALDEEIKFYEAVIELRKAREKNPEATIEWDPK